MMNMEKKQQQDEQQKKKEEKIWVDIPNELLMNIVLQLPADSLIRFKCASKFWYNFITDPHLVKLHLNRATVENKLSLLIRASSREFYSIDSDAYSSAIEFFGEVKYDKSKLCNNYALSKMKVLGSCHGILLMSMNDNSSLCLLNPCTQELIKLPSPTGVSTSMRRDYIYGFGCDSNVDDYKVIQIREIWLPDMVVVEVMIYSLQENLWRMVEANDDEIIPFLRQIRWADGFPPIFLSGCAHWLGCYSADARQRWRILSFDFGIEEFREVPVLDVAELLDIYGFFFVRLGVLRECLSMVCYFSSSCVDVFLMKEYGVGDSWCKLHSISNSVVNRSVITGKFASWIILCYTNNGKMLVQVDYTKLYLYDPETELLQSINLHPRFREILHDKGFSVLTYIPSLVPLGRS